MIDRAIDWSTSRREPIRKYGLAAALIIFAVGLYLAVRGSPGLLSDLKPGPLIILIIMSAPLGTILNAVELWALSRIAGGPMSLRTSFDVTIYTSAANMLPLPGGAITKLAGFRAHGVGYAAGTSMILLSFVIWGALAFLYSAAALALLGKLEVAGLFLIAGLGLSAASVLGFARFGHWGMVTIVAATRLLNFVAEGARYWLALSAMGVPVNFLQCSVFVIVAFVGAAVVIVPSGLGVSEAAGAWLATLIGMSAGAGFLATAIHRVTRLAGLAVIAVFFLLLRRSNPMPGGAATPDPLDERGGP